MFENKQLDWRIRHSHFGVYTVSQSRSVETSAENPAPDNSPQSIGELHNGHVANLQELYIPDWFEKWRDIKF